MKKLVLLFVVLGLVSCKKENQTFSKKIKITQPLQKIITKNILEKDIQDSKILYIGKEKENVEINKPIFNLPISTENLKSKSDVLKEKENIIDFQKFVEKYTVYISKKIPSISSKNALFEFNEKDSIYFGVNEYNTKSLELEKINYYSSFPIFLKNISKDTIDVQSPKGYLLISLEAKNRKNIWKPINKQSFMCGYGITSKIILPPNEIIITSMYHYKGNFKTKLRLKFLDFVSREFDGSINEEQLK